MKIGNQIIEINPVEAGLAVLVALGLGLIAGSIIIGLTGQFQIGQLSSGVVAGLFVFAYSSKYWLQPLKRLLKRRTVFHQVRWPKP